MESKTFEGVIDKYYGITVDSQKEPCEVDTFLAKLSDSISNWRAENIRCIWFKVNIKDAAWVPILANNGFNFHHARGDFVMLYRWLSMYSPANLPPASHTNLGVGGLVLNNKNQILVVMEKHTETAHWKLPGGYVERGEDIKDAAVREIKEETGIDADFETLVTFRHTHNRMFGNSDIYMVVMLTATSDTIDKSDIEIEECQWMDVEEFLNHPNVYIFNKYIVQQAMDLKEKKLKFNLSTKTENFGELTRKMTSLILEEL